MTKETSGDTENRMLAVLLKAADGETLRHWTETYAAENPSFCRATIAQLRERCMPKMDTPEAWQEKIGDDMENLFEFLSLMDVKEAVSPIHAAVSAFFRQVEAEYNDYFLENAYACVVDAGEKGKELLLNVLRSDEVPQERKREILKDMDDIRQLSMYCYEDYFGMEGFSSLLSLVLLPEAEAVARLDEMIAKEPAWAAYPYIMEKERLLRKLGRTEEAKQLVAQHGDILSTPQMRVKC